MDVRFKTPANFYICRQTQAGKSQFHTPHVASFGRAVLPNITNVPNFWNKAKAIKSLVRSDHLAVLLKPVVKVKATRKTVEFRDLREHNKLKMLRKMDDFQWTQLPMALLVRTK